MVRAWYIDNDPNNPQLEHHRDPPEFLTMEEVFQLTGVEYFSMNIGTYTTDGVFDEIKKQRGFVYGDELIFSKECMENYEETLKKLFTEHLHAEDEIRLVTEGSSYFDVRDTNDEWIRIQVEPGDMLIHPKGIYHRFTLDANSYAKLQRFFVGKPVWSAHNRPADHMECRKEYVEKMNKMKFH